MESKQFNTLCEELFYISYRLESLVELDRKVDKFARFLKVGGHIPLVITIISLIFNYPFYSIPVFIICNFVIGSWIYILILTKLTDKKCARLCDRYDEIERKLMLAGVLPEGDYPWNKKLAAKIQGNVK